MGINSRREQYFGLLLPSAAPHAKFSVLDLLDHNAGGELIVFCPTGHCNRAGGGENRWRGCCHQFADEEREGPWTV